MNHIKSILIKNIYYMLSYAFTNLNKSNFEDIQKEDFDNIHNLFAAILAKGIGKQLKQGIYREYINKEEDVSTMKGKILIQGSIKNMLSRKLVLNCEFDELSENNLLNQILKTTVILLLKHGNVDKEHKSNLKRSMLFFSNVDTIQLNSIKWSTIGFHRNNQTYRMLISICELILDGMILTNEQGENRMASFLDEQKMHRLFEKFILEYYVKHFPSLSVRASQIPWSLDEEGLGTMLPIMQSDITISHKNRVLIIDAKYYSKVTQSQYDKHTLWSNNLYQIFTYVKNKDAELRDKSTEVSGMLLYAKTDEPLQPDNAYKMSGNKISVKTLDLNLEFVDIQKQLDSIVIDHFKLLE